MESPWYHKAFGPHYSDIYAHRDRNDALRAIGFVRQLPGIDLENMRVLDLCCGEGRHSVEVAKCKPPLLAGMDLSRHLLEKAREIKREQAPELELARGNMIALPYGDAQFDLVLNLFTSFGYFMDDKQNAEVLAEAARVLVRGGILLLDHINPAWLREHLVPRSSRNTPGGLEIEEYRRVYRTDDQERVEKRMVFEIEGEQEEILESVRIYEPEEMRDMALGQGLILQSLYGDFDGSAFEADSPRAIYVFQKTAKGRD
ncbi:MAG: class I SAM-dependent methyltransferase [Candidatus Sumerlaeia bacterium]